MTKARIIYDVKKTVEVLKSTKNKQLQESCIHKLASYGFTFEQIKTVVGKVD